MPTPETNLVCDQWLPHSVETKKKQLFGQQVNLMFRAPQKNKEHEITSV